MNVISTCYAPLCGHRVIGQARVCPRCGGRMRSPQTDRAFGLVLLGCGLFVMATGAVTWYVAPQLAAPGAELEGARFAGDPAQARTILQFFWLTIAFGVAAAAAGAWRIATARRSPLVHSRGAGAGRPAVPRREGDRGRTRIKGKRTPETAGARSRH